MYCIYGIKGMVRDTVFYNNIRIFANASHGRGDQRRKTVSGTRSPMNPGKPKSRCKDHRTRTAWVQDTRPKVEYQVGIIAEFPAYPVRRLAGFLNRIKHHRSLHSVATTVSCLRHL